MDGVIILIFQLAVLIFSVMVHEVSHGAAALKLGDTTAKDQGRLTLNPVKHLDVFGSIVLPITLYILSGGAFVMGWAKPVPFNPNNLKNPKRDSGIIAMVGPLSNLTVAIIFGLILRLIFPLADISIFASLILLINFVVFINILLAIFN